MTDPASPSALEQGNLAVITGGASGIGLAAARALLAMGLRVCIVDADKESLSSVLRDEREAGRAQCYLTDVADREAMVSLAQTIAAEWGPVSFLMNNAGIASGGGVLGDPAAWDRLIAVNLMGVFNGLHALLPGMMEGNQPGIVVNTGSKQGITQPPGNTAYNVSKAGVRALTEGLAHTLREETGGRLSAHLLVPGFTYTGMMKRHFKEKPAGAWTPEQVVERMFAAIRRGEFYILCPDNEVTEEVDRKRIAWSSGDILNNRPALSRWHPDYKDAFERFMQEE